SWPRRRGVRTRQEIDTKKYTLKALRGDFRALQTDAVMRPLLTEKCPFHNLPSSRKSHFSEGITAEEMKILCWLKPKLVAQISLTAWADYGLLRHATFHGLRDDK